MLYGECYYKTQAKYDEADHLQRDEIWTLGALPVKKYHDACVQRYDGVTSEEYPD